MVIFVSSNASINRDLRCYLKAESRFLGAAALAGPSSVDGELYYINSTILGLIKSAHSVSTNIVMKRNEVSRYGQGLYAEALIL